MNVSDIVKIHRLNVLRSVLGKMNLKFLTRNIIFFQKEKTIKFEIVYRFSSQASSFNCEMSDLDQSELKPNVHFARTNDRDFWLFSWVYDVTCRDKVATIGGSNRANNDRRMDIFREKDGKRIIYSLCT